MKKTVSLLLVLAMLLSLCACAKPAAPAAPAPQKTETAAPEATEAAAEPEAPAEDPMALYRTGKPWILSDLEGVVTEDISAELKDDFALFINRDHYINAQIPEGYYCTGAVDDLSVVNAEDLLQLFAEDNDFSAHDSKLVKAYYDLLLDWDTRNALGVTPLKTETEVIEAMTELDDLIVYYRDYPLEKQLRAPFSVYMDTDLEDPDLYIATADPCGVMLGDSAEYSELTELGALYRSALHDLAVAMLLKLGYSQERAQEMWEEAYHLEELMAPYIYTSEESNTPDFFTKINNHMTRDEVVALQGRLPVVEYLELTSGFGRQENWLITNPGFFEGMQSIFTEENLPLFKSWIICLSAISYSRHLDRECYDLYNAANIAITGTDPLPEEIVASGEASGILSWQTAHMYCDTFFTQQDKDAIQAIIEEVIATYKEMLMAEDFISEQTKAAAVRKLDAIRIRNLYPDDWNVYTDPGLTFRSPAEGGTLWEAIEAISNSNLRRLQEKVKQPVNHELWNDGMTPTTVNCFYNPSDNSINILAAFCRGDVYSADMSHEEICGKMGIVIAHEITHAFDDSGSQFDETGAFRNWWTEEDSAVFAEKTRKLADYYSAITLWEGANVNGDIKTGEACADMGAMKCMLTMAASEEAFDYDAFFRSYADLWRTKQNMYVTQSYRKDPHPMGYIRINTVLQQFDEFLDCYGITEGDGMYLAPADRVAIW